MRDRQMPASHKSILFDDLNYRPSDSFAEKLNSGSHCEERERRGNLMTSDFIMNKVASLRSQ
jgi:hypothetical protein